MKKIASLLAVLLVLSVFVGCNRQEKYSEEVLQDFEAAGIPKELIVEGAITNVSVENREVSMDIKKKPYEEIKAQYTQYLDGVADLEEITNMDTDELVDIGMYPVEYQEQDMEAWMYQANIDEETSLLIFMDEKPVNLKSYTTIYIKMSEFMDMEALEEAMEEQASAQLEGTMEMETPETEYESQNESDLPGEEAAGADSPEAAQQAGEESAESEDAA